jgi:hydrogenase expression/formation protein HypC
MGVVELEGIRRRVFLGFLEDVQAGDYVLIHAGCAVERLRPEEAEADLEMFRLLLELEESAASTENTETPEDTSSPTAEPGGGGSETS